LLFKILKFYHLAKIFDKIDELALQTHTCTKFQCRLISITLALEI